VLEDALLDLGEAEVIRVELFGDAVQIVDHVGRRSSQGSSAHSSR